MVESITLTFLNLYLPLHLTYDGCAICCTGQKVVHDEQEDSVAQDEGHLEGGSVDTVGWQVERQDVDEHEEWTGDQQVDHVEHWPPLNDHLMNDRCQFDESDHLYYIYTYIKCIITFEVDMANL